MRNFITSMLPILFLVSCANNNEKSFCDKDFSELPKNVITNLDKNHKNALSDLTSILNGFNGFSTIFDENQMYGNITYELFFDIGEPVKNLYIVRSKYQDNSPNGSTLLFMNPTNIKFLKDRNIIEVPIKELNEKRISYALVEYTGNLRSGNYLMNINIYSQYNNSPFKSKFINYENGKPVKTI